MSTIFRLNLRLVARSIDRSSGSPMGRWVLTAAIVALPLLMVLAGESNDQLGVSSVSAEVANLLIVAGVVGPIVVLSLVIAWRADARLLEVFQVSPLPTAVWQFALLAPSLVIGSWVGLSTAAPIAVDVASNAELSMVERALVLSAGVATLCGAVAASLLVGLVLRRLISVLPARLRTPGRSVVLIGSTGGIVWAAVRGWTSVNRTIADHELAVQLGDVAPTPAFSILLVSLIALTGGSVMAGVGLWSATRVGFTPIEASSGLPLSSLPLSGGSNPALLSVSWLRNPHTASHMLVAVVLFAVGVVVSDVRWLAHGALLLVAAGFVGFAPGNVAMRSIVGVGARRLMLWFVHNGLGAVILWSGVAGLWAAVMRLLGESVIETVVAATLVVALALIVGGLFAHSFRTSFGAELASLVVYFLGAAMVFALVGRGWFARPPAEVLASSGVALAGALAVYATQSALDGATRRA